jgi:hypothetical protein
MPNQELVDYINKAKEQNISEEEIRNSLKEGGWGDEDVNEVLGEGDETKNGLVDSTSLQKKILTWIKISIFIAAVGFFGASIFDHCSHYSYFGIPSDEEIQKSFQEIMGCFIENIIPFLIVTSVALFVLLVSINVIHLPFTKKRKIIPPGISLKQNKVIENIKIYSYIASFVIALGFGFLHRVPDFLMVIIIILASAVCFNGIKFILTLVFYPIFKISWRYAYRPLLGSLFGVLVLIFLLNGISYIENTFLSTRAVVDKPVIYLYPETQQNITVQLDYQGELIADYPVYDKAIGGWSVVAYPDGRLVDRADDREYSYLFWEGIPENNIDWDLSTGFVVKGEDTREFLQNTLSEIGLTPKEYNEFIVYWYPKMKDNSYNLVHFAGTQYTQTAPLTITPEPDSILRVFMVFKPLNKKIEIESQILQPFERKGFTVVEWGGTESK